MEHNSKVLAYYHKNIHLFKSYLSSHYGFDAPIGLSLCPDDYLRYYSRKILEFKNVHIDRATLVDQVLNFKEHKLIYDIFKKKIMVLDSSKLENEQLLDLLILGNQHQLSNDCVEDYLLKKGYAETVISRGIILEGQREYLSLKTLEDLELDNSSKSLYSQKLKRFKKLITFNKNRQFRKIVSSPEINLFDHYNFENNYNKYLNGLNNYFRSQESSVVSSDEFNNLSLFLDKSGFLKVLGYYSVKSQTEFNHNSQIKIIQDVPFSLELLLRNNKPDLISNLKHK
jgi:hypothetical protein